MLHVVLSTRDKYPELLYIYINVAVHEGKALCFGYKEAIVLLKIWNKHFPKGTVSWDFWVLFFFTLLLMVPLEVHWDDFRQISMEVFKKMFKMYQR